MIAILGFGPSRGEVPEGVEKWGLACDPDAPRYDRLFELHDESLWPKIRRDYAERMRDCDLPVFLQREHEEIPKSQTYPRDEIAEDVGDYFGSSVAYMLAMAVHERCEDIGLWGVDLSENIYDHQRPNLEYLIGLHIGRGGRVHVPLGSALLCCQPYGYLNGNN